MTIGEVFYAVFFYPGWFCPFARGGGQRTEEAEHVDSDARHKTARNQTQIYTTRVQESRRQTREHTSKLHECTQRLSSSHQYEVVWLGFLGFESHLRHTFYLFIF